MLKIIVIPCYLYVNALWRKEGDRCNDLYPIKIDLFHHNDNDN